MDAGDGCSGGSGLRLARALKRLGREEDEVCKKPNPSPPFISQQRQPNGPFRCVAKFFQACLS